MLEVMKMLHLHHCLLCKTRTLNNLTKKSWLQTYILKPEYIQLKITFFISACLIL